MIRKSVAEAKHKYEALILKDVENALDWVFKLDA